ncbi:MAG TPA: hypothetical protein VFH72_11705 [Candidatus Baltobacteraceae bacterium]|nr:hypothetical protein [Candidatus Baltobacteraceae bacterium]
MRIATKVRLPWWCLLSWMAACALIMWPLLMLGRTDLIYPTLTAIGVLGFTIAVKWELRRYAWFWVTMAIIAALHAAVIFIIPWTSKWVPALAIAAIASGDFILILVVFDVIARVLKLRLSAHGGLP